MNTSMTGIGDWYHRTRELSISLVKHLSVTETCGETTFAEHLHGLLAAIPYFKARPAHLRLERTKNDLHERYVVFALVKGRGRRTVALAGHYDVVSTEPYGSLSEWAHDPEALLPRLVEALERDGRSEGDKRALADLKSGDFLPGRGMLDMKSGLAAGMATLERFGALALENFSAPPDGNLLLIACPDEENSSHGARSAMEALPDLLEKWEIDLECLINLDAADDKEDGYDGQAVFLGSVGKHLPSIYVVGRPSHAGSPFEGVSASLIAAEIVVRAECRVDLADTTEGEMAPPPANLKLTDLKSGYDITTPWAAWCYFNHLTHRRRAWDMIRVWRTLCVGAMERARERLADRAEEASRIIGTPGSFSDVASHFLTYDELLRLIPEEQHSSLVLESEVGDPSLDTPELTRRILSRAVDLAGVTGPACILAFGSLFYPAAYLDRSNPRHSKLLETAEREAVGLADELGTTIRLRPFFPGVSDMSYFSGAAKEDEIDLVKRLTPAWGRRTAIPTGVAKKLDLPVINIGPWGRDFHQRNERVYAPYSFGVVPELVWRVARAVLSEKVSVHE